MKDIEIESRGLHKPELILMEEAFIKTKMRWRKEKSSKMAGEEQVTEVSLFAIWVGLTRERGECRG